MNQAYSGKILARILTKDEVKWLDEKYDAAKISLGAGKYSPPPRAH